MRKLVGDLPLYALLEQPPFERIRKFCPLEKIQLQGAGFAIYARKKFLRELLEVAPGVEPGVLRARLRRRLRDEVVGQRCAHRGGLARIQPVKEHRLRFRQSKGWESFFGILLDPEIPGIGPIGISESDHSCARLPPTSRGLSSPRQALGRRDQHNAETDENHLHRAGARVGAPMQSRDESRDRDVEKSRGREGERVREEPERMAQAVVRRDRPDHRGDAGGEIEQQRARA